jgi:hypothetical protein
MNKLITQEQIDFILEILSDFQNLTEAIKPVFESLPSLEQPEAIKEEPKEETTTEQTEEVKEEVAETSTEAEPFLAQPLTE